MWFGQDGFSERFYVILQGDGSQRVDCGRHGAQRSGKYPGHENSGKT